MALSCSVIVPSFNSSATIEECLASIAAQTPLPLEVILADSSTDATPGLLASLAERWPRLRVIRLGERTWPGRARDLAIREARGDVVACLDADCTAGPDWLREHLLAQGRFPVVGGPVLNANPGNPVSAAGHLTEFAALLPGARGRREHEVATCNVSYRRSLFERYGGFGDLPASEDMVFHHRLLREGVSIGFAPGAVVRHRNPTRLPAMLRKQAHLGRHAARARRLEPLPGRFFARHPALAFVLPPARYLAIWRRLPGIRERFAWLALFPLTFAAVTAWGLGFRRGARARGMS